MWPIEKRCQRRDTNAFVASETVDLLGEKLVGIIADRRITKMHRYLGESGGRPTLRTGLRVWHGGFTGPTVIRSGQSASVQLASHQYPHASQIGRCVLRRATLVENLRVLVALAERGEQ